DLGGRQRPGGGEQQGLDPALDLHVIGGELDHGVSSNGCPDPRRFRYRSAKACACFTSMAPSLTSSRLADRVEAVKLACDGPSASVRSGATFSNGVHCSMRGRMSRSQSRAASSAKASTRWPGL